MQQVDQFVVLCGGGTGMQKNATGQDQVHNILNDLMSYPVIKVPWAHDDGT